MADPTILTSAQTLDALLLSGLMGLLGQGIRSAIGLKKVKANDETGPTQQATFSVAYFGLSMMIGFIAGIVAGIALGLKSLTQIDPDNMKILLGIAAAGYAGADFIENSLSIVLPNANKPAPPPAIVGASAVAPDTDAMVKALNFHADVLASSVSTLANLSATAPVLPADVPSFKDALHSVAAGMNMQVWEGPLTQAFGQFGLTTKKRVAAAIGQFLVEAGTKFQEINENLKYTTASRLVEIFPSKFPNEAAAQPYLNNPEKLGNKVYANKLGNGDEASGDGYRFRGRGLIQLTGRDEYAEFGGTIGRTAEEAAAYCETPLGAAVSGCWYLSSRGCLPRADAWEIDAITRLVNGRAMVDRAKRAQFSDAMLRALS